MAGGFDVAVAEETLNGDDVGARLQEPRGVGMSEFVEGGLFYLCLGRDVFESPEKVACSPALGIGENPFGGPGEIF